MNRTCSLEPNQSGSNLNPTIYHLCDIGQVSEASLSLSLLINKIEIMLPILRDVLRLKYVGINNNHNNQY